MPQIKRVEDRHSLSFPAKIIFFAQIFFKQAV